MGAITPFLHQIDPKFALSPATARPQASSLENDVWRDTLLIPLLATGASLTILLLEAFRRLWTDSRQDASQDHGTKPLSSEGPVDLRDKIKQYTRSQGGSVVLSFKITRFVGCITLFSLSIVSLITKTAGHQHAGLRSIFKLENFPETAIATTYLYTSVLSAASLSKYRGGRVLTRHNICILLTVLGVYGYRDIWPLATYTQEPADYAAEGGILWAKLSVLTVTAFVIPMFIPRQYIPVDPKNPMEKPNREQTASLFSLMVYTFLDHLIYEASQVPHLPHDRLPWLADSEQSKYMTEKAFVHLDPLRGAKKRHLFFSLTRVFYKEYLGMAAALVVRAFANFGAPLALNKILNSLETEGQTDSVRPWFWVACLFLGPFGASVAFQSYLYFGTTAAVRTQAILTELVFEHSLRVRFKAEASTEAQADAAVDGAESKKKDNLVGKINTLVTVDVNNILTSKDYLLLVLEGPLQLTLALSFLYSILGWSAMIGFVSIVVLLPVPGYLAGRMQGIQSTQMEKTDARVQAVVETVGVLRMVKLFGWEKKMSQDLKQKREEELHWLLKDKTINLINSLIVSIIPLITMIVTYAAHTLLMGQSLNPSKVFSSMAVFSIIRTILHTSSYFVNVVVKGKVSLERVGKFLRETELLDRFSEDAEIEVGEDGHDGVIGFKNAEFSWSNDVEDGTRTPSTRAFRLRTQGELKFKKGSINLIVGPTGSGKTSILMALLGEMHFIASGLDSWYSLPRSGGVAYAAQESWVENDTIRQNILFGTPYDEERYNEVIRQCALAHDLELFEAGDQTEVGERGLTLSGGQKARVTLARAVYSPAEIILLDDILAALDVHTAKVIVNDCLQGDLIRGRTVLLVTHNIALTSQIAEHIISIGLDGVAHEIGKDISTALAIDPALAREVEQEQEQMVAEAQNIDTAKKEEPKDGKLMVAEDIVQGRVTWKSMMLYIKGLGGTRPIFFMTAWVTGFLLMHTVNMFALWFLGYWGSQYEIYDPEDVRVAYYLSWYSSILLSGIMVNILVSVAYNYGTIRASRSINAQLIDSLLGSTLRWLDETPAARIINRCTGDISVVDEGISNYFAMVADIVTSMAVNLAGPVILTPIILLPGILIAIMGVRLGNIYLKAQMSVKREMSNARSPVLAQIGASITGLTSIRAYNAQASFRAESLKRIDHYTKIARASSNLNRWIGIRTDLLAASFTTALASYLLINRTLNAANIGFSLTMSIEFCTNILWLVQSYNTLEVQANSLERIQAYLEIEHEPKSTPAGTPPASWPNSGELRVEGLSSRYSATGPKVLHDISFDVKSGERIGIVGRTGSGKSSLTLSLLRCILTEGVVCYDGLDTSSINLDVLRSSITIVPQIPELLSGSLRRNLDPFGQHDDAALNNALQAAGLFSLQQTADEGRLSLDSNISGGGNNLSVGQRQIIALARAMVRNSKLLILDEATSAIDHKTDSIIQSSLRNELGPDVTVLIVAHRLQTIMDADKIMVLNNGHILEFDAPHTLLQKEGGYFKSLVDNSSDRKELYSMLNKASKAT